MKNAIKKIKYVMEHHYCLQRVVPIMRKLGMIHILHILCERTDRRYQASLRYSFRDCCICDIVSTASGQRPV